MTHTHIFISPYKW